jgi:hypothetical protein
MATGLRNAAVTACALQPGIWDWSCATEWTGPVKHMHTVLGECFHVHHGIVTNQEMKRQWSPNLVSQLAHDPASVLTHDLAELYSPWDARRVIDMASDRAAFLDQAGVTTADAHSECEINTNVMLAWKQGLKTLAVHRRFA